MHYQRLRLTPEDRKRLILNAAFDTAMKQGVFNFSIANVSRRMKTTSKATIRHYFTISQLRSAVIQEAVDVSNKIMIGEAIAMKHPVTDDLPENQRKSCLTAYLNV